MAPHEATEVSVKTEECWPHGCPRLATSHADHKSFWTIWLQGRMEGEHTLLRVLKALSRWHAEGPHALEHGGAGDPPPPVFVRVSTGRELSAVRCSFVFFVCFFCFCCWCFCGYSGGCCNCCVYYC